MSDLPQGRTKSSRIKSGRPPESFDASHPLIVFDGACVLCSGFMRLAARLDRQNRFRFATAQSPFDEALFRRHGPRTDS
ncbi:DCC1-like thiol-disulfide oxidoreductase family protein [Mesorhizobium sp. B4-1-4]|uniref:DCC1-like thiol-disulfide oxidoreductase family protein n=1 Tax=Mesorhizobium sp. B4-1-4 TaxID=2589888 RepID=UPI001D01C028|nr:DCC1-like thiol-disulfide oxidoreductase family protein [Mesorhizobium sp. B4-1-4]UCI30905.1 DUF393 domain-containing protein [Mesorhizobium sp. B4-1-4]